MIKLTYQQASNPRFVEAFSRIANTPMNIKLAYNFKKIADRVISLKQDIIREYETDLIDKFAKKDEHGALVRDESNQEGFVIPEANRDAFKVAEEEFGTRTVTLDRDPISLNQLLAYGVSLSPAELKVMEPVLLDDLGGESSVVKLNPSA